ncbi:MAG TPA: 4Fe-4S dicluster domain-containing protein [Deltaproteobacteria bacterium]|nr:4Fe-4S dicluster domain-containing protein [Deltaproteobacteria bacterium]
MGKRPAWYLWILAKLWKLSYIPPSVPILGKLVAGIRAQSIQRDMFNISHLPINAQVTSVSTPLPVVVLENIIRESDHRTIIHRCTCREARGCTSYDIHTGCLHIGAATEEEDTTVARHATVEEAIAHLHKAVDAGLIPFMGHAAGDNVIWNVSKDRPFLTVCFCCPCCCTLFFGYKYLPEESKGLFHRLRGITIEVDNDRCTGCGACVSRCFTQAITLRNAKAFHDEERCKGCGVCASVCPEGAVSVRIHDLETTTSELFGRVSQEVGGVPMRLKDESDAPAS